MIERWHVACAASGKAGGFLARGWGSGPTRQLHQVSFDLHEEIARDLKLQGYRKLATLNVAGGARSRQLDALISSGKAPVWLDGQVATCSLMDADTAQTTPYELTSAMMDHAVRNGARVMKGKVEGVRMSEEEDDLVTGVVVDGNVVEADCVIIGTKALALLVQTYKY